MRVATVKNDAKIERKVYYKTATYREKDDYDSETPGSQMGSPAAAEGGGEAMVGGRDSWNLLFNLRVFIKE